jgi:hypothetical protein
MNKGWIITIIASGLCLLYFGGLAIGNLRQAGIIPPVNGSTGTSETREFRILETIAIGHQGEGTYFYSSYFIYSGYRDDYSGYISKTIRVAVFTVIIQPAVGGAPSHQFYIHIGEAFTLYGKNYTLKSINDGSVTLEVSG